MKEIEVVSKLSREARVEHFIKRVVGHEELWGIQRDGWVLAGNGSGLEVFQVWPHEEYARLCCVGEWADCEPAAISMDDFMSTFVPDFDEKRIVVGVFYTPTDNGVLIPPYELAQKLQAHEDEWY
jgi:hypothetical protein